MHDPKGHHPEGQDHQGPGHGDHLPEQPSVRSFRSRGIDVQIRESKDRVELMLDGVPIHISVVDGKYHSQLANQFTGFSSVEAVVEMLLSHQGKTWSLHGHVCDESCGPDCHHHETHPHTSGEGGHTHAGGHEHGTGTAGGDDATAGHTHAPGEECDCEDPGHTHGNAAAAQEPGTREDTDAHPHGQGGAQ